MIRWVRLLSILFLITQSVMSWGQDDRPSSYILCRNQKIVRTIRISQRNNACQVVYSKEGQDKMMGESRQITSCQQVLGNIERNLSEAGWKCRDVSATAAVIEGSQE